MAKTRFNSATETVKHCRKLGWLAQNVERFNSFSKRRLDLFGCFDVVAVSPEFYGTVYIQCACGSGDGQRHIRNMMNDPGLYAVLEAVLARGNRIEVWEWNLYLDKTRTPQKNQNGRGRRGGGGTVAVKKTKFYFRDAKRWSLEPAKFGVVDVPLPTANELYNLSLGIV
jgi:hypothetical protein